MHALFHPLTKQITLKLSYEEWLRLPTVEDITEDEHTSGLSRIQEEALVDMLDVLNNPQAAMTKD